jgi:hypothetical protein
METKSVLPLFGFFYSHTSFENGDYEYLLLDGHMVPFTLCMSSYDGNVPAIPVKRVLGDEKFIGFYSLNNVKRKEFFELEKQLS